MGTARTYNYVFNYTDHLGNNRLSYGLDAATGTVKIIEENNYYPAVGRFFSVDRMSEMFMNFSPYQYAGNNPVFFIDVNGEYIYINDVLS